MTGKPMDDEELERFAETLEANDGNVSEVCRIFGKPRSWGTRRMEKLRELEKKGEGPIVEGAIHAPDHPQLGSAKRRTYLFTCAQNNTRLNPEVWQNLQALAEHYRAEIIVGTLAYNISAYGEGAVKKGTEKRQDSIWYDPEILPYVVDDSRTIAHGLIWNGELNIIPTAVRPLSSLEAYKGRASTITPHTKLAMESVASAKYEPTKFLYTTGAVTQRNYIQKKAGQRAQYWHTYGALLVEVDEIDGEERWWCRQVTAGPGGILHDLNLAVIGGHVHCGGILAVNYGDIHVRQLDPEVWGATVNMAKELRPTYQFIHDVLDFQSRNHHHRSDPHTRYELHITGKDDVHSEVDGVAAFLYEVSKLAAKTVVVDSNHDRALERWLREEDYRTDPKNAMYFLKLQSRKYEALHQKQDNFHLLEWAVNNSWHDMNLEGTANRVKFLREDESFILDRGNDGGIECGHHGHLGANGGRGSTQAFVKTGRRVNKGHDHSAAIRDGVFSGGVTASLDMGYNRGLSSWSNSHIITYPSLERAIITIYKGLWRRP